MNSFIHQGRIQLIKCVSRGNYNVTKDYDYIVQINAVLLNLLFIKKS